MKKKVMKIELLSDLAAGSGYAFGATIDSDIVFDDAGLPYIPARRIKGVMKEAAENISLVLDHDVDQLFGIAKDDANKGFIIEDGLIKKHVLIRKAILAEEDISDQEVLSLFTRIRTQTRMVDGVADDKSLRRTRVVNQYSPFAKGENLIFYAKISFEDEMEEDLRKIASATKAIGLKRNRGLGQVKCLLSRDKDKVYFENQTSPDYLGLKIEVENVLPLMISAGSDTNSESYVPGRNMIGALASMYIESGRDDEKEFENLFLNGSTCFTNLYISDWNGRYIPAPAFVQVRKNSGNYNNILQKTNDDALSSEGVPKKLTGKYVCFDDQKKAYLKEGDRRIIYHHRKVQSDDVGLYTISALTEGQRFTGYIYFSGQREKKVILDLLKDGVLRFGKSKTAQYGKCEIVKLSDAPKKVIRTFGENDVVLVSLVSNAVFMNGKGYTISFTEVYDQIAKAIGLEDSQYIHLDQAGKIPNHPDLMSFTSVSMEFGYQTQWNMRKAPVPSISAGSTFVYQLCSQATIENNSVGIRCFEGYGEVMICELHDYPYRIETEKGSEPKQQAWIFETRHVLRRIYEERLYREVRDKVLVGVKKMHVSSSSIGRLTLMLKESSEKSEDPHIVLTKFRKRIDSIQRNEVKTEIQRFVGKFFEDDKFKDSFRDQMAECRDFTKLQDLEVDPEKYIFTRWESILMECLSKLKYMNKEKE